MVRDKRYGPYVVTWSVCLGTEMCRIQGPYLWQLFVCLFFLVLLFSVVFTRRFLFWFSPLTVTHLPVEPSQSYHRYLYLSTVVQLSFTVSVDGEDISLFTFSVT